ncbi:class I SAM-dependent methyltransferase [Paenisporosarcina cavernae]|uniref:Class I SAM-dependent methyltransferase n=1 Tax=Paenisporosarcina cavernae TaxID=2320858 RepID=A0A385YYB3_9BACL|nr:class I SAM-dependent methyltransferase [Paenisporosarcina cavernae]AYC30523.1 class I SAM-dependent methyltransferase [Paenisporosarcina cavernae]
MNIELLRQNKSAWEEASERFFGRDPLPSYGPMTPSEDSLQLFQNLKGAKVLDLGCGSGHSLKYMERKGASELWGIDLSNSQIEAARNVLSSTDLPIHLLELPMEMNEGIPTNYFDVIYSIYAVGWTTHLEKTFMNVSSYLKQGGQFIFSWEHPMYNRLNFIENSMVMEKTYLEEGIYRHPAWNEPAYMQQVKISTYVNLLISAGFHIKQIVEESEFANEDYSRSSNRWYNASKASYIPTTIIFSCVKV